MESKLYTFVEKNLACATQNSLCIQGYNYEALFTVLVYVV